MEDISDLEAFILISSAVIAASAYGSLAPSVRIPIEAAIGTAYGHLTPRIRRPVESVGKVIIKGYRNLKIAHEGVLALCYPSHKLYYD